MFLSLEHDFFKKNSFYIKIYIQFNILRNLTSFKTCNF